MNAVSSFFLRIANSNWFQAFIIAVILLAGVVVGIQTYELSSAKVRAYSDILGAIDTIILTIFTIEVVVKVLAEGNKPWNYFKDPWNIFDFLIVAVCYLAFVMPTIDAGFIAVLRLARILRVFKLVTALPKLQMLVAALLKTIPSMFYVGILLGLLFYIYAAMGVFVFGENDPVHFGSLHKSMLSLFRVVTLEDWTDIMYINMFGCDVNLWGYGPESGCLNPKASPILGAFFFVSFVLIGTMIVLNLFIGVIMSAMDEVKDEEAERVALERALVTSEGASIEQHIDQIAVQIDGLKKELDLLKRRL
jgi:voltage-gated sodium channel